MRFHRKGFWGQVYCNGFWATLIIRFRVAKIQWYVSPRKASIEVRRP